MHGLVSGFGVVVHTHTRTRAEESMGHLTYPSTLALGLFQPHLNPPPTGDHERQQLLTLRASFKEAGLRMTPGHHTR